ncbi:MAG: hypothetical protein Q7J69_05550 [Candidatus Omnitrophota bacterium]|nr:hypothetical protein [Candidatus Omnitrophota bacterium]
MSNETPPPVAPAAPKRRSGWLLLVLLLLPYVFLKFQALSYARQAAQMEKELDQLRPALSARVLSEQLENTRRACQQVSDQVRRLDLRNGEFLEQLSNLPASITLERIESRAGLKIPLQGVFSVQANRPEPRLQTSLKVQGVLSAGIRDPEWVLARWAQSLQGDGMNVHLRRLVPSAQGPALWSFELYLEGA